MKNWLVLPLIVTLLMPVGVQAAPSDADRKTHLDLHLREIEESARRQRYIGGGTSLGLGAIFGVGAIITAQSSDPDVSSVGPVLFGISGGVFVLAGLLQLALRTDFETEPEKYRLLPAQTPEQIRTKVAVGETTLQRLSDNARRQRLIGAGTLAALGAAEIVWWATGASSSYRQYFLYQGILFAGLGIVQLFVETAAESEFRAYSDWKSGGTRTSFHWNIVPVAGGGAVMAALRF